MQERISLSEDLQIPKAAKEVIKRKAFNHFHGNILMTPVIFITLEKKSLVNSYLIFLWGHRMLSFLTSETACSVCVHVCMQYVCVCGLYVHFCFVHVWCVCVNVCFCVCVCLCVSVCLCMCVWYLRMYIFVDVCIWLSVCACMHVLLCACV